MGWFRARQPSQEIHEGTNVGPVRHGRERSVRQNSHHEILCNLTIHLHRGTHTWPQNMILLPSGVKRVTDAALQEWMKRYDPVWCQFVPHHRKGGNDAVMNDLVSRQLIQRLIDQCLVSHLILLLGQITEILPLSTPSLRGMSRTVLASGAPSSFYQLTHPD